MLFSVDDSSASSIKYLKASFLFVELLICDSFSCFIIKFVRADVLVDISYFTKATFAAEFGLSSSVYKFFFLNKYIYFIT